MIDSIKFYRSYYEAIKKIPIEKRGGVLEGVMDYCFNDTIPKFEGIEDIIWGLIKPNLDSSIESYNIGKQGGKYGKKGGRPKKENGGGLKKNNPNRDKDKDKDILLRDSEFFNNVPLLKDKIGLDYGHYDLEFYYKSALAWSDNGNKKIDWVATIRNFILRDEKDNKAKILHKKPVFNK